MSDTSGTAYMIPGNASREYERTAFRHEREMAKTRGLLPVKVMAVYQAGGGTKTQGAVEQAGFVDVQPLVSQVDGAGVKQDHGTIYHVPYTRIAGGSSAIIMDPVVGDIGFVKVADRDISSFKDAMAGGQSANSYTPNSRRRHDLADSVYVSTLLTGKPGQYVTFQSQGIVIHDASGNTVTLAKSGITIADDNNNTIVMASGQITITATTVKVSGNLQVSGSITAGEGDGDQVGLQTHTHDGVQSGPSNTGPPNAGT